MASLRDFQIQHPDEVGSSEYRAIYECIDDALSGCEEDVAADPGSFALEMLSEFIAAAKQLRYTLTERIEAQQNKKD